MAKENKTNQKKGITLLVAVLITSVALLFSLAISNIALKEVILTQLGRDSQVAFYASNSGMECALYHDLKKGAFDTSPSGSSFSITCAGNVAITGTRSGSGTTLSPWVFKAGDFYLEGNNEIDGPCFDLYIKKENIIIDGENVLITTTESRGYNTCEDIPKRLERALRATY